MRSSGLVRPEIQTQKICGEAVVRIESVAWAMFVNAIRRCLDIFGPLGGSQKILPT